MVGRAERVLMALEPVCGSPAAVAGLKAGVPLFEVRATLTMLARCGLVERVELGADSWRLTQDGADALVAAAELRDRAAAARGSLDRG